MSEHAQPTDSGHQPHQDSNVLFSLKKIEQHLTFLERKIDILVEKAQSRPFYTGPSKPYSRPGGSDYRSERPGYRSERPSYQSGRPGYNRPERPSYRSDKPGYQSERPAYRSERPDQGEGYKPQEFRQRNRTGVFKKSDADKPWKNKGSKTFKGKKPFFSKNK